MECRLLSQQQTLSFAAMISSQEVQPTVTSKQLIRLYKVPADKLKRCTVMFDGPGPPPPPNPPHPPAMSLMPDMHLVLCKCCTYKPLLMPVQMVEHTCTLPHADNPFLFGMIDLPHLAYGLGGLWWR